MSGTAMGGRMGCLVLTWGCLVWARCSPGESCAWLFAAVSHCGYTCVALDMPGQATVCTQGPGSRVQGLGFTVRQRCATVCNGVKPCATVCNGVQPCVHCGATVCNDEAIPVHFVLYRERAKSNTSTHMPRTILYRNCHYVAQFCTDKAYGPTGFGHSPGPRLPGTTPSRPTRALCYVRY
eukprot:2347167-Rhodomonas_salina.1